jgi:tripartite-type tricarboxylate transporter receptor subunit TctC
VPTLSESGFPGLDVISAQSLLVPAGTPQEIVVRLNAEISKILEMPEMKSRWSDAGFLPQQSQTPAQVAAWFAQESQKWGKLIKEKNITAD